VTSGVFRVLKVVPLSIPLYDVRVRLEECPPPAGTTFLPFLDETSKVH
jgi:hypothetical protein